MPSALQLRPPVQRLAEEPDRISNRRIWRALTPTERETAILAVLDGPATARCRPLIVRAIAEERHFRVATVASWGQEKLASFAGKGDLRNSYLIQQSLFALHLAKRPAMLGDFLNALAIPHVDGAFDAEPQSVPLDADALASAADGLVSEYSHDEVIIYLSTLLANYRVPFGGLSDWLASSITGDQRRARVAVGETVTESDSQPSESNTLPVDAAGFTTLDRRLILTIVDSVASIVGAASEDEVDDLLLEIEQLNGRRHATFFHLGFRDSLFGRPEAESLPAENEQRRRCYWAGYVNGLARRDAWGEINRLFDAHPSVRKLGESTDGPMADAPLLVFRALTDADRLGEAGAFLTPNCVTSSPSLRRRLLDVATRLIRESRAAEARPLLDLLATVVDTLDPEDLDETFVTEVQRRRALCLRQTGGDQDAMRILRELAENADIRVSAVARSDIGLIRAGFRRLGEIALPEDAGDLPSLVEALERGEPDFRSAAATSFRPAHANYVLGVLALCRRVYDEADTRLSEARAFFRGSPDVYRRDGTLPSTELYLGIAICHDLSDPARVGHARELIVSGLTGGAKLPLWLVKSTIDSLALMKADVAAETAADILGLCGDRALDQLLESHAAPTSLPIMNALVQRAASPSRPVCARVEDYRRAVPWLVQAGDVARANDALEYLEEKAADGVGRAEFLQLLTEPTGLSPVWNGERVDDARLNLLEVEGRYADAAAILLTAAYKCLADPAPSALDNAELILGQLESYGPSADDALAAVRPVIERRLQQRDLEATTATDHEDRLQVRILVFGGNEVQARMDESIRDTVARQFPGVSVEFIHSGWSGNWGTFAAEFERRVVNADGVVFLQLMRTMLGRTVRANCHLPWRGCRGRGQGEIVATIARVLPAARARLRAQNALVT